MLFELCADSLEAARAAQAGGADRLELCEDLPVGGVTPRKSLLRAVLDEVSIPVHVLVRPRGGDFVYTSAEFQRMRDEIEHAKAAGAAGVVIGVLRPDGRVDVERTRELALLARPMKVTFHRAFDESNDLEPALEDVILTGADCLLTSGGAPNVREGADRIGRLMRQAAGRIEIMAGGGLRLASMAEVVRRSRVTKLHGSLLRPGVSGTDRRSLLELDIREAMRVLKQECLEAAF
ncbi:copper homeostasis protein CutC [Acidicapsa acidisoli]|uniref:copper homeostasis protein CutC n=1 Tax=Acidicapsa acidisoli TaxID=1615681 RepID=UPI0021E02B48|nr:copper homeostasis protein CutC [Acidicapsa acidisoli]